MDGVTDWNAVGSPEPMNIVEPILKNLLRRTI